MTKRGAKKDAAAEGEEEKKKSAHVLRKVEERKKGASPQRDTRLGGILTPCGHDTDAKIDALLESQFAAGRLYAAISSRPGQSGRADGYILEGRELEVRSMIYLRVVGRRRDRWLTLVSHGT